jgi:hypothetical protein
LISVAVGGDDRRELREAGGLDAAFGCVAAVKRALI